MGILAGLFRRVNTGTWGHPSIQTDGSRLLGIGRRAATERGAGYREAAHGRDWLSDHSPVDRLVYTGGNSHAYARAVEFTPGRGVKLLWEHAIAKKAFNRKYWGVAVEDGFLLSWDAGVRFVDAAGSLRWQHTMVLSEPPLRVGGEVLLVSTGSPWKEWRRVALSDGAVVDEGVTTKRGSVLFPEMVEMDQAQRAHRGGKLGIGDRMNSKPLPADWKVARYLGHVRRTPLVWLERPTSLGCEVAIAHLTRERNLIDRLELGEVRRGGRQYSHISARWVGELLTIRTTLTTGDLRGVGTLVFDPKPLTLLGRAGEACRSFFRDGGDDWWEGRL